MFQTDILEERYPNLSFLLRFHENKKIEFSLHSKNLDQEIRSALAPLNLQKLEVVYIYGLGLGHYFSSFKEWLKENKERDLVFIEENLSVLESFLEMDHAKELLSHPQVHLRLNLDKKRLDPFLQECAQAFPFENIGVISLASYKKHYPSRFYRLRLKLHRFSTVQHAIFLENQYYNLFVKNLLPNFKRMGTAFNGNGLKDKFSKIPAVICGAGPSLENDLKTLHDLDNQALIFAGGSAITALSKQGIRPHFGVAIDPNFEEVHRFNESTLFEVPLFYAPRLHPEVFNTFNGPHGYLHTKTGGPFELWMETQLGLEFPPLQEGFNIEALSVTTTAIELAATLGCDPIILVGVDLAFTNDQAYTSGVVSSPGAFLEKRKTEIRASERLLKRRDIYDKPIYTLVKWVMESAAIGIFAKENPQITLINATSGGIGFEGISNVPLHQISMPPPRDLHGQIHQAIQNHPLPVTAEQISTQLKILKESLLKAESYVQIALKELNRVKETDQDPETGRVIFAQMELETLDAYTCFLAEPSQIFTTLLNRKYRPTTNFKWNYLHAKWGAYEDLIHFYLELFVSVQ